MMQICLHCDLCSFQQILALHKQKGHLRHAQACCDGVPNAGPHQVQVLNDATEPHIPGHAR